MATQMRKCPVTVEAATISKVKVDICQQCGNTYIIVWLRQNKHFNDFGDRHCPFCGHVTDEFHLPTAN